LEAATTQDEGETPRASPAPSSKRRARLLLAVKLLVTIGALAFTFSRLSLTELAGAVRRLQPSAVVVAAALTLANLALAGIRWRILLAAYGATHAPPVAFLVRAQLVGHFYNTFVPGNVTGDVLRAHATRRSFETPLGSYMVVGLERFFGLAGLFTLGAVGLLLRPLPGVMRADLLAALAFATATAIALIPIAGRSLGRRLPGRLGRFAAGLPAVARPGLLGVVMILAVVAHAGVALTGHVLIDSITPEVAIHESIVLVPLTMIATYVPFSVAGLGVREAAFVLLFGKIGVRAADATAASLAFFAVHALVASLGGLVHLVRPLASDEPR
jgi:uncharacterized membrane protein YbhN (UPF0104 family)